MSFQTKPNNKLKVVDNEGFYDPNQKGEFKGVFHGVDVEKQYYEAGAHFSFFDLCRKLDRLLKSPDMKERHRESTSVEACRTNREQNELSPLHSKFKTIEPENTSKELLKQQLSLNNAKTRNTNSNCQPKQNSVMIPHHEYSLSTINAVNNPKQKIYTTINQEGTANDIAYLSQISNFEHSTNGYLKPISKAPVAGVSLGKYSNNPLSSQYKQKSLDYNEPKYSGIMNDLKPQNAEKDAKTSLTKNLSSIEVESKNSYNHFSTSDTKEKSNLIEHKTTRLQNIDSKINFIIKKINQLVPPDKNESNSGISFRQSTGLKTIDNTKRSFNQGPSLTKISPYQIQSNTNLKNLYYKRPLPVTKIIGNSSMLSKNHAPMVNQTKIADFSNSSKLYFDKGKTIVRGKSEDIVTGLAGSKKPVLSNKDSQTKSRNPGNYSHLKPSSSNYGIHNCNAFATISVKDRPIINQHDAFRTINNRCPNINSGSIIKSNINNISNDKGNYSYKLNQASTLNIKYGSHLKNKSVEERIEKLNSIAHKPNNPIFKSKSIYISIKII